MKVLNPNNFIKIKNFLDGICMRWCRKKDIKKDTLCFAHMSQVQREEMYACAKLITICLNIMKANTDPVLFQFVFYFEFYFWHRFCGIENGSQFWSCWSNLLRAQNHSLRAATTEKKNGGEIMFKKRDI